jgi:tRNA(Ile)-lysidine synthase
MTLLDQFRIHLAQLGLPRGGALIAVSGGPDSVALLDLLVRTGDVHGWKLTVAHLDHGIHPESARVADHVRRLADSYGLRFEGAELSLGASAGETLARARRYAWLESTRVRIGADFIVTAHHADDQLETVLMRVLGGSGPAGLAGMTPMQGRVVRPLLAFRRAELKRYAEEAGLISWVDPANTDPRHLRSWIRTEVMPMVRERVPALDASLQRLSRQAARDKAAWDLVLERLPGLEVQEESDAISVAASPLQDYDSPLAETVILALARRAGCQLGPSRVGRVFALLRGGVSGRRVPLGGEWTAEVVFDRLRMFRNLPRPAAAPWSLEGEQGEGAWGQWRFRWERATAPAQHDRMGLSAWFTLEPVTVRGWVSGERLKPLGGTGHRPIVRCFQEVRVPRSRRSSWPVLAQSHDVIWIPGVCRSDARLPVGGTEALRVDAEYA